MPDQDPQHSGSELASFGEDLRREREIRGISLKEISDATKISKRFLEAIESNDHRALPAPVFTRGFVREYARYVGLNSEEMVNRYNFAAARDDRIEKPPQIEKHPVAPPRDITPRPKPKRGIPPAYARVDHNAIFLVLIIIALAGVAWWTVEHKRADAEPVEIVAPPIVVKAAPVPIPPPKPAETADSVLHLTLDVTANCWVTLESDGKTVLSDEVARGDHRTFDAQDSFRFRTIGNAAGIVLTLNGVAVPPLGGDGEVIKNRVLDRPALAALRSADTQAKP
jgi:cytoskeleton protein RodZ